jgi:acyl-[acyl-carrier-protein] desaturase
MVRMDDIAISPERDVALLHELTEPIAGLLNAHLAKADDKMWYPHEFVPFDQARTFPPGYQWSPEEYPLSDGARSALYVNLLTEDNLPYYSSLIVNIAGDPDHPMAEWGRRWTAEEARHSEVMRGWIHATRALNPRWLEDGRIAQMSRGEVPQPATIAEMLTYTSLQELATQVAHRNTLRQLPDKAGKKMLGMVAGDEGLHYDFYVGVAEAGFQVDPSTMMIALAKQLRGFKMPGTGIINFKEHSDKIADADIYGPTHFHDHVVWPVIERLDIEKYANGSLSPEAERAHEGLLKTLSSLTRASNIFAAAQQKRRDAQV